MTEHRRHKDANGDYICCCFCGNDAITKQGKSKSGNQNYYCRQCKKVFSNTSRDYATSLALTRQRMEIEKKGNLMWALIHMGLLANDLKDDHSEWAWG